MRVLGIDPGLTRCGLGIVTLGEHRSISFEHVEVLRTKATDDLQSRIGSLGSSIERIIKSNTISEIAIERVFVGENLPSVMGVAQITGVVLFLATKMQVPVTFYAPNEVKSNITGYGAANKAQMTNMIMKVLKLQVAPKPADAADALALAVTHARALTLKQQREGLAVQGGLDPLLKNSRTTPARQAWLAAEKKAKNKR